MVTVLDVGQPDAEVDLEVCERQAFGGGFSPTARDVRSVADLKAGRLILAPHPEWSLPPVLTWSEDPFGQRNWRAQLHMLRWLDPLRRQALSGDREAANVWWRHVQSWLGSDHGAHRRFAWMDMVDGVRAKALVLGYPLVPEDSRGVYLASLREHGRWLSIQKNRGHSNHELHQLLGLFIVARFLRHEAWTSQAVRELGELLVQQYDEEGVNAEGALAYHLFNYRWWRGAVQHLAREGFELPDRAGRLERARLQLVHATRPDGFLETIGDTDRTRMSETDSPEMTYVSSGGADGVAPEKLFMSYSAGYVFGRSGWGEFAQDFDQETFYSVMHGSGVKVHGHDEAGALTYFTRGRSWLIDPGKYAYVNDEWRRYFVSRGAHNVLFLPGLQRDPGSAVRLVKKSHDPIADDMLFEDEGYEGARVRRRVVFHRPSECLVILDTVFANRKVVGEQRWNLAPDVETEQVPYGYRLTSGAGDGVRILWSGTMPARQEIRGERDPVRGWAATGWMKTQPTTQIRARHHRSNFRFVTIVGPEKDGELAIEASRSLPGGMALKIRRGKVEHTFSVTADAVLDGWEVAEPDVAPPLVSLPGMQRILTLPSTVEDSDHSDSELIALSRQSIARNSSAENRLEQTKPLMQRLLRGDGAALGGADAVAAALVDVAGTSLDADVESAIRRRLPRRLPMLAGPGTSIPAGTYKGERLHNHDDAMAHLAALGGGEVIASTVMGDLVAPWAARDGSGDVLVVRLHGALDRQNQVLPTLVGLTSARRSELPYLVLQDPSLDLDAGLRLAWYLGSPQVDGHAAAAALIEQARAALQKKWVLLVGSSGGGFTALHLAALVRDSHALAFNPQTDLAAYFKVHTDRAARACLGVASVGASDAPRLSVTKRWTGSDWRPSATIVLNSGDTHHVAKHVEPFESWTREQASGGLSIHHTDLGPGHVALPQAKVDTFIGDLVAGLGRGGGTSSPEW